MFFLSWWQGLLFGLVTTVAMCIIGYVFSSMWDRYEEKEETAVCHPSGHEH